MQPGRQFIQILEPCRQPCDGLGAVHDHLDMIQRRFHHFVDGGKILSALPVGNAEDRFFRLIHDVPNIFRTFISHSGNSRSPFHQLAQDRFFFHDLGMVLGVGRRGHHIDQ